MCLCVWSLLELSDVPQRPPWAFGLSLARLCAGGGVTSLWRVLEDAAGSGEEERLKTGCDGGQAMLGGILPQIFPGHCLHLSQASLHMSAVRGG